MPTQRKYEAVLCNVLWYEPAHVDFCSPTFGRALGNSFGESVAIRRVMP